MPIEYRARTKQSFVENVRYELQASTDIGNDETTALEGDITHCSRGYATNRGSLLSISKLELVLR